MNNTKILLLIPPLIPPLNGKDFSLHSAYIGTGLFLIAKLFVVAFSLFY